MRIAPVLRAATLVAAFVAVLLCSFPAPATAGTTSIPSILSVSPARNATNVQPNVVIKVAISFGGPTLDDSIRYVVTGSVSGRHKGTITSTATSPDTLKFAPLTPFIAGEHVIVTVSSQVVYQGYQFDFWVRTTTSGTGTHPGTFGAPAAYNVGNNPAHVATGNLRPDVNTDVVVTNTDDTTLSIFAGTGSGGALGTAVTRATPAGPQMAILRDVNMDGYDDLLTANQSDGSFSVWLNNQAGSFNGAVTYSSAFQATSIAVADLNNDGFPDVIVQGSQGFYLHTNNGTGAFSHTVSQEYAGPYSAGCGSLAAGDIDGDGDCDILAIDFNTHTIFVYLNAGTGTLASPISKNVITFPRALALGDLTGDGLLDFIVVSDNTNEMQVYTNSGSGAFLDGPVYTSDLYPWAVALADIDGDGDLDFAEVDNQGTMRVLGNDGTGHFPNMKKYTGLHSPTGVCFSDLNGDGIPDIIAVNNAGHTMNVYLGDSGPVPIQLSDFGGFAVSNAASLSWTTTSETNNYGFYVQRRAEGDRVFFTIPGVFIPGSGTSLEEHHYAWTDTVDTPGTYYYRLKQLDNTGDFTYSSEVKLVITGALGVTETGMPSAYALQQNYPNPFNPSTEIRYSLPVSGNVSLRVYNSIGQIVATLVDGFQEAGFKSVRFEFSGAHGNLPSGVYWYRLTAGTFSESRKMIFAK